MRKLYGNKTAYKKDKKPGAKPGKRLQKRNNAMTRKNQVIYGSLIIIGIFFAAAALRVLIGDVVEDAIARTEYEQLRIFSPNRAASEPEGLESLGGHEENDEHPDSEEDVDPEVEITYIRALTFDDLKEINDEFIGWINIGSHIDYPVVRGRDNYKYINTTFTGSRNSAGAIFMDYRNAQNFDEYISILYGHLARDGTMFSSLLNYLEPAFMQSNPYINITTREGAKLAYRVFAAYVTDAWDPAYSVGFYEDLSFDDAFPDVPENASRFLLLSTCTRSNDDDERLLVFAALAG